MFRRANKGLTIIEVLIVLAISTGLAVISIGAFSSRGRTQDDDAARQVLANIALVRNQAQQGQGPAGLLPSELQGAQLFGQAIEVSNGDNKILVKKIAQKGTDLFVYETQEIINPVDLSWNTNSGSGYSCANFTTCYGTFSSTLNTLASSGNTILSSVPANNLVLVFKNRTGESYALTSASYLTLSNYSNPAQQKYLRLALAKKGKSTPNNTSPPQYYFNFDLSIPNNQDLQVLK